jgi:CRISPR/Cas system CSM-associated protein Csm3 (group 7 of RAMP superfamily)
VALNCRHLERLTSLTVVVGQLTCDTGLHIGTGERVSPGASDLPVVKDGLGRPYIPGSSLKGVLRAYAERLIYSLTPVDAPPQNRNEMSTYLSRFERCFTSCLLHGETPYCLSASQT